MKKSKILAVGLGGTGVSLAIAGYLKARKKKSYGYEDVVPKYARKIIDTCYDMADSMGISLDDITTYRKPVINSSLLGFIYVIIGLAEQLEMGEKAIVATSKEGAYRHDAALNAVSASVSEGAELENLIYPKAEGATTYAERLYNFSTVLESDYATYMPKDNIKSILEDALNLYKLGNAGMLERYIEHQSSMLAYISSGKRDKNFWKGVFNNTIKEGKVDLSDFEDVFDSSGFDDIDEYKVSKEEDEVDDTFFKDLDDGVDDEDYEEDEDEDEDSKR